MDHLTGRWCYHNGLEGRQEPPGKGSRMTQMTGGQALVQSLLREGVEVVFGLPGVQLDWAFDALYEARDRIAVYHTRHEQATSYMADGYARAGGRVGTCLVVPGPGLLNAMAGLSTAYACSSPVLCLSGQIQLDLIGRGRGVLHEIPHQLEMLRSVTKWAARAAAPAEIPGLIRQAFEHLQGGRPRPVALEIPPDVLAGHGEVTLLTPSTGRERPASDPDLLRQAAVALNAAERPLIYVGGGIFAAEAWEELRQVAEALQAPVVMSANGRGALSDHHPLALSSLAGRLLLPRADLVLTVGSRMVQPAVDWGLPAGATTVHIDIDPDEIGRNIQPTIGIVGDAKRCLTDLLAAIGGGASGGRRATRAAELAAVREHAADLHFEIQPQASLAQALRSALPEDGLLVSEMTQVGYFARTGFPVYEPRTFFTPGYQGTLGYGLPTALGAKIARPERKVVSISGDGGFLFNSQELSTMKRHDIGVVAVVFNDNAFGNVKRIQQQQFGGRLIASELANPDFVKLAESFGIDGLRATSPVELEGCLREALATERPVLIEVPVGEMPGITQRMMNPPVTREWW